MDRKTLLARLALGIAEMHLSHPVRVGIDGVDNAGKTTLADELTQPLQSLGRVVIRASIDGFHHPRALRYARGPNSPVGYYHDSFNVPGLIQTLLTPLGPGGNRSYRTAVFDYRGDHPVDSPLQQAPEKAVLLFDGVFLQRESLRAFWDLLIFVEVPFSVALARAIQRDQDLRGSYEVVKDRYLKRYFPGQRLYFKDCSPKEGADAVVENSDFTRPILTLRAG